MRGQPKIDADFRLLAAAANIARLAKLGLHTTPTQCALTYPPPPKPSQPTPPATPVLHHLLGDGWKRPQSPISKMAKPLVRGICIAAKPH